MTPEQALELLDKAAQSVATDRQGHVTLMEAVKVLSEAIKATPEEE